MRILNNLAAFLLVGSVDSQALEHLKVWTPKKIPKEQCTKKSMKGDVLEMHYTGSFLKNDEKFDSSHDRGKPFKFILGQGKVIKGWDQVN